MNVRIYDPGALVARVALMVHQIVKQGLNAFDSGWMVRVFVDP
jgi:hypothetical protein